MAENYIVDLGKHIKEGRGDVASFSEALKNTRPAIMQLIENGDAAGLSMALREMKSMSDQDKKNGCNRTAYVENKRKFPKGHNVEFAINDAKVNFGLWTDKPAPEFNLRPWTELSDAEKNHFNRDAAVIKFSIPTEYSTLFAALSEHLDTVVGDNVSQYLERFKGVEEKGRDWLLRTDPDNNDKRLRLRSPVWHNKDGEACIDCKVKPVYPKRIPGQPFKGVDSAAGYDLCMIVGELDGEGRRISFGNVPVAKNAIYEAYNEARRQNGRGGINCRVAFQCKFFIDKAETKCSWSLAATKLKLYPRAGAANGGDDDAQVNGVFGHDDETIIIKKPAAPVQSEMTAPIAVKTEPTAASMSVQVRQRLFFLFGRVIFIFIFNCLFIQLESLIYLFVLPQNVLGTGGYPQTETGGRSGECGSR